MKFSYKGLFIFCLIIFDFNAYLTNLQPNLAKVIATNSEHYINVPFYYQVKTYYCGPAALQMVFDYFGGNISQFEIAEVARTVPYVTYTDELRRAAHFSNISTSRGSEMTENITGYTARELGYGAFEIGGLTIDNLKSLIDSDYPVILLMRWIPGEPYGHYRVAVGYNETHIFLHDPWNNVKWGGDYGGPNLPMNYTFFDEMWDYSGHWALFVSPWNVKIETPNNVYVNQTFTVRASIKYVCPTLNYSFNYEASSCEARIVLPEGLSLADGETAIKNLGDISAGETVQTSWIIKANSPGNYTFSIEAEGQISGFVGEKPDVGPSYEYTDRIGGYGSSSVNVSAELPSQICITSIQPSEGVPGTEIVIQGAGATPNGTVVALLSGPVNQTTITIGMEFSTIRENAEIILNMTVGWTVANSHGFWTISFVVPQVPPGEYKVYVVDNSTQKSDSTKFYVLSPPPTQVKVEHLTPAEGYPGTDVFIAGYGATPKGEVKIYFDSLNVANIFAYEDGSWYATLKVPNVRPGNYTILVLDVSSGTSDSVKFNVLSIPPRNVGVKEGDWAKYDVVFNYSTNDPEPPIPPPSSISDIEYLLIKIVSVEEMNVTYESTMHFKNGTETKNISWFDISTGLSSPGFTMPYGPIIAANLTAGDKIYLNAYAPTINFTLTASYVGVERKVNCYQQKLNNVTIPPDYKTFGELTIYWDQASGMLCEQKVESHYINVKNGYKTDIFLRAIISETNIWAKPSTVNLTIVSATGGTTNPPPNIYSYPLGTELNVTAIPDAGYSFDYWLLDGEVVTENPITIIMDSNHTLEAHFIDDVSPEISQPWQNPSPENVQPFQNVTVWVNVTELGSGIKNVTLWYSLDNGITWTVLNMTELPIPSNLTVTYEAIIPGYKNCTWITYKIVAYDRAGNTATKDNNGFYYRYHVIPEYTTITLLALTFITTLVITLAKRTKIPK